MNKKKLNNNDIDNNHEVIVDRKYAYDNIGINQVLDIRNINNNYSKQKNAKNDNTRHIDCQKDKNVTE